MVPFTVAERKALLEATCISRRFRTLPARCCVRAAAASGSWSNGTLAMLEPLVRSSVLAADIEASSPRRRRSIYKPSRRLSAGGRSLPARTATNRVRVANGWTRRREGFRFTSFWDHRSSIR